MAGSCLSYPTCNCPHLLLLLPPATQVNTLPPSTCNAGISAPQQTPRLSPPLPLRPLARSITVMPQATGTASPAPPSPPPPFQDAERCRICSLIWIVRGTHARLQPAQTQRVPLQGVNEVLQRCCIPSHCSALNVTCAAGCVSCRVASTSAG